MQISKLYYSQNMKFYNNKHARIRNKIVLQFLKKKFIYKFHGHNSMFMPTNENMFIKYKN